MYIIIFERKKRKKNSRDELSDEPHQLLIFLCQCRARYDRVPTHAADDAKRFNENFARFESTGMTNDRASQESATHL